MKALMQTCPALVLLALSATVAAPASSEQAPYRVIVHPDNPVDSLSKSQVSEYLLKKKSKWDHGTPVAPVSNGGKDSVRVVFSKEVHGRSVSSIKNYWQRQIAAGTQAPPELASDAEVVAFVRSNPGAIGYVSASARLAGVKEIALVN